MHGGFVELHSQPLLYPMRHSAPARAIEQVDALRPAGERTLAVNSSGIAKAIDLMVDAPTVPTDQQMRELHLRTVTRT
jgi:hypothetical protein